MRCLSTYKCQSELVADQKLNKITSEFQTQKLAEKQSKVNWFVGDQKLNKITSKSQTEKLATKKPQDFVVGGEKQRLPINVKNGF